MDILDEAYEISKQANEYVCVQKGVQDIDNTRMIFLEAMKVDALKELCEEVKKVSEHIDNLEYAIHKGMHQ